MTIVVLVRHGLTRLTGPVLAGWTPGLHLDERGQRQAAALAERLADVHLDAVVSSPLDRCLDTAGAVLSGREQELIVDDRLGECGYGDWTGRSMAELATDPLWKTVQQHPSAVVFPGPAGEALRDTQARAVAAVRDWNQRLGPQATWLACSHGDVIKSVVADAMGLHLDLFQRIVVDPCSVTVIRYTDVRPFVVRVNETGDSVATLAAAAAAATATGAGAASCSTDAAVGGGAGGDGTGPA